MTLSKENCTAITFAATTSSVSICMYVCMYTVQVQYITRAQLRAEHLRSRLSLLTIRTSISRKGRQNRANNRSSCEKVLRENRAREQSNTDELWFLLCNRRCSSSRAEVPSATCSLAPSPKNRGRKSGREYYEKIQV